MMILLAPSKTLDFDSSAPAWSVEAPPVFLSEATEIMERLKAMDKHELAHMMHVSDTIAATNHKRFEKWGKVTKPALWAYRGDVYKGMYADQLTKSDADWAQERLCIMSGLYGIVRPYDAISPYRLEMKAKLEVGESKDLYKFWDEKLSRYVDERCGGVIYNLSSDEYGRPVTRYSSSRVITPVFMDHRPSGNIGPAPIYNKMMRGVFAHWMIQSRIDDPSRLHEFTGQGYSYDASRSTLDSPVFLRPTGMKPLVF